MTFSTKSLSTCDIFKSSTCHIIVHCFPFTNLLAKQWSYGLILNPQSVSVLDSMLEENGAESKKRRKADSNKYKGKKNDEEKDKHDSVARIRAKG